MAELIKNKIYLCADGDKRLLIDITENHLVYGVEIKKNVFMEVSPIAKKYILEDFLNGTILEEESSLI